MEPKTNTQHMNNWLVLLRDKVDLEIGKVSIDTPLLEISAMISGKIEELQDSEQTSSNRS
jgi:hypothetical protein